MASRVFTRVQYGIESTPMTAVAATRAVALDRDDHRAIPQDRTYDPRRYSNARRSMRSTHVNDLLLVEDELAMAAAYFQILPMIYQCLLDGTISPTETTGGQADYVWAVAPSFTAANAPDSGTWEFGDDTQAVEVEGVTFKSIKLTAPIPEGNASAPVALSAPWFGRQVSTTTFTAGQVVHSGLTYLSAKLQRLYMDTTYAGIGGTEQAILRGSEVEIMTGNHPKFFGSADKYFTTRGEDEIGAMITLDLERGSASDAIYDLFRAGTQRALRLDYNGPQIGTGVNYQHRVDVFGRFISFEAIGKHVNGNNIDRAVFVSEPDSSGNELAVNLITNHNTV